MNCCKSCLSLSESLERSIFCWREELGESMIVFLSAQEAWSRSNEETSRADRGFSHCMFVFTETRYRVAGAVEVVNGGKWVSSISLKPKMMMRLCTWCGRSIIGNSFLCDTSQTVHHQQKTFFLGRFKPKTRSWYSMLYLSFARESYNRLCEMLSKWDDVWKPSDFRIYKAKLPWPNTQVTFEMANRDPISSRSSQG